MKRKRKAIPLEQQLASALACLLPQAQRDELRAAKVPAQQVIRLFSPDHIGLWCFEAPDRDRWYNISPMLRGPHKEKSRRDTAIAAKTKRLRRKNGLDGWWEDVCKQDRALKAWADDKRLSAVQSMAEVIDRQIPRQARRKGRGAFSGSGATKPLPKPKRSQWPPKGARKVRWWGVAKKQRGQEIGES